MFLLLKQSGDLVRLASFDDLLSPFERRVEGFLQAGEEEQEATWYSKEALSFPSGEPLPACWTDPDYHAAQVVQAGSNRQQVTGM